MSKRSEIVDGSVAEKTDFGIVYTCDAGWVDVGHAGPGAATQLWALIRSERGEMSPDGLWFRVPFQECMGRKKWGMWYVWACEGEDFGVRYGLSISQKESVALGIFLRVSRNFEAMQGTWPQSMIPSSAASSFSAEDLISDLIGFYRVVRPGPSYVKMAGPVSKADAERVWDTWGAAGSYKNRELKPILFPCSSCQNSPKTVTKGALLVYLTQIQPAKPGILYRRWSDIMMPRVEGPVPPIPRTATVQPGDSLSKIAQQQYGDMFLWPIIYDANRPTIGNNPNLICPGQVLTLPDLKHFSSSQLAAVRRRGHNWR
jgi:hypothetical protein